MEPSWKGIIGNMFHSFKGSFSTASGDNVEKVQEKRLSVLIEKEQNEEQEFARNVIFVAVPSFRRYIKEKGEINEVDEKSVSCLKCKISFSGSVPSNLCSFCHKEYCASCFVSMPLAIDKSTKKRYSRSPDLINADLINAEDSSPQNNDKDNSTEAHPADTTDMPSCMMCYADMICSIRAKPKSIRRRSSSVPMPENNKDAKNRDDALSASFLRKKYKMDEENLGYQPMNNNIKILKPMEQFEFFMKETEEMQDASIMDIIQLCMGTTVKFNDEGTIIETEASLYSSSDKLNNHREWCRMQLRNKLYLLQNIVKYIRTLDDETLADESIILALFDMISWNLFRAFSNTGKKSFTVSQLNNGIEGADEDEELNYLDITVIPTEYNQSEGVEWAFLKLCYIIIRFLPKKLHRDRYLYYFSDKFIKQLVSCLASQNPQEREIVRTCLYQLVIFAMRAEDDVSIELPNRVVKHVIYFVLASTSGEDHSLLLQPLFGLTEAVDLLTEVMKDCERFCTQDTVRHLLVVLTLPMAHLDNMNLIDSVSRFIISSLMILHNAKEICLSYMAKIWPWSCSKKQCLFINVITDVLEEDDYADNDIENVGLPIVLVIAKCISSDHFRIADLALTCMINSGSIIVNSSRAIICAARHNRNHWFPVVAEKSQLLLVGLGNYDSNTDQDKDDGFSFNVQQQLALKQEEIVKPPPALLLENDDGSSAEDLTDSDDECTVE